MTVPRASCRVVQAVLLSEALRLDREGEAEDAFDLMSWIIPVIAPAAGLAVLSELTEGVLEEM